VLLDSDQISLAIGKGGANIKLASMLTGYTIDVYREIDEEIDEDDISLDQFSDDIEDWIIDILKKQGYTTARQVLGTNREELAQKADLEEETVDEIIRILSAEFEK
jgi:N utilization substance protein A